jgi:nucleoside-diphosphate-sugar epimerase
MQRMNANRLAKTLITGGTGFVGSYLAKRLVDEGVPVRILDNNSRGRAQRLRSYIEKVEYIEADVTSYEQVCDACRDIDTIFHLAFVNGTENFYRIPERVLEVGVKGAINTMDAAMACGVSDYIAVSSSEVYQEPVHIPTSEAERIIIPDVKNPRFSYSGGKIITELLALHYAKKGGLRTVICRPHNFYGPDMGYEHVIPQFVSKMKALSRESSAEEIDFETQGTGEDTRAFCYIDDAIDGIILCATKGVSGEIYNIGTEDEVSIGNLAEQISDELQVRIRIKGGKLSPGSTKRRCPDITRIRALGYEPKVSLREGLSKTIAWYIDDANLQETCTYEGRAR